MQLGLAQRWLARSIERVEPLQAADRETLTGGARPGGAVGLEHHGKVVSDWRCNLRRRSAFGAPEA